MKRFAIMLLAAATLASCGKKEDLRPEAGHSLPQKPALARETPGTKDLLTSGPEARPERDMEQIRRSEERQDDPFDLPPKD